jgi:glutamate---cysteine ligase / carboxylate-amine ligase
MTTRALGLFDAVGVEIEYMVVRRETLDVVPLVDTLFTAVCGGPTSDVEFPDIGWSNELAAHVLEIKTGAPVASLDGLAERLHAHVRRINAELDAFGARLMPGGVHPWMDPLRETELWPHGPAHIYRTFDRIFDCRGHGWSNLQALHVNLPFQGDDEFARLHAAVRLLLPLLPALTAASPVLEGRATGWMDGRLREYERNCARLPSITGQVVPESVGSRQEYEERILAPMYRDIAPFDPEGVLQTEWLNARGAIARFSRSTIEIRVLDTQESPRADVAVTALVTAVLQALVEERWSETRTQAGLPTAALKASLDACAREGAGAPIVDAALLQALGCSDTGRTARAVWTELAARVLPPEAEAAPAIRAILRHGTLAERILRAWARRPGGDGLRDVYRRLADTLAANELFEAGP